MAFRLSIIIVNHDAENYTFNCVSSVQKVFQGFKDYEVIIVDNSEKRADFKRVREILPEAQLIRQEGNSGFGSANNLGAKYSSGNALAFVNPDVELKGDLEKAVHYLEHNPGIGVMGIRLTNANGTWQNSYGNLPTLWRKLCETLLLSHFFKTAKHFAGVHGLTDFVGPRDVDWVSGAVLLVRREAFSKINGFDEDYFLYFEDIDICKRIKDKGWRVVYYPFVEAVHYLGGDTKASGDFVIDHGDSPYIYFRKHKGKWSLPVLWLLYLMEYMFKTSLFFILAWFNKSYLKSFHIHYNTLKFTLFNAPQLIFRR